MFYQRMKSTADNLTERYGKRFEILEYDSQNNSNSVASVMGVMASLSYEDAQNSAVRDSEGVIYCQVPENLITERMYVKFADKLYSIVKVEPVQPDGTKLIYKIYVK